MDNLNNFYNSLFTIEFTVLSILLAGLFLLLQIIHENRLYKFVKGISWLKLYTIGTVAFIALGTSALASLLSSLPSHDFISFYNLHSREIILEPWFALSTIVLFFISTSVVIWIAISEIISLRPAGLIKRVVHEIKGEDLRKYLLTNYGLQQPFYVEIAFGEISEEEHKKNDIARKNHEKDLEVYESLTKERNENQDLLEPIGEMTIRAIRDRDTSLLVTSLEAFETVLRKDIYLEYTPRSHWNPNVQLFENLIEHYLKWTAFFVEECKKEGTTRLQITVYDYTYIIAYFAFEENEEHSVKKVISYWKIECDKAIADNPQAFIHLVNLLKKFGTTISQTSQKPINKEILDEVYRSLGWLAERLLHKVGIEETPLMYDESYETSYGAIFNALMAFEWEYISKHPASYPLIYFDAIWVLFLSLVTELNKNDNEEMRTQVSEHIFHCLYVYSSFATAAIDNNNNEGACLATLKLTMGYKELNKQSKNLSIEKITCNSIGLLIQVAFNSAGKKISAHFMPASIEKHIYDILCDLPSSRADTLASEITTNYISANRSFESVSAWSFIKRLGMERKTNFGFMFDWKTGEDSLEKDTRRR